MMIIIRKMIRKMIRKFYVSRAERELKDYIRQVEEDLDRRIEIENLILEREYVPPKIREVNMR